MVGADPGEVGVLADHTHGDGARRGGAGLGLSIVQAVVSAHGGEVGARSAPGEGATFEVRLPLGKPPPT
ncbi:ATP-binding protein [Nonomuraea pusilla]|uniref:ATP-binding protein n=1 Tax=Nonomuraea pusilla TaxID=46177 RepID=UPI0033345F8C